MTYDDADVRSALAAMERSAPCPVDLEDRLLRGLEEPPMLTRPHRRLLPPLLAAAAVIALAVGLAAIGISRDSHHHDPAGGTDSTTVPPSVTRSTSVDDQVTGSWPTFGGISFPLPAGWKVVTGTGKVAAVLTNISCQASCADAVPASGEAVIQVRVTPHPNAERVLRTLPRPSPRDPLHTAWFWVAGTVAKEITMYCDPGACTSARVALMTGPADANGRRQDVTFDVGYGPNAGPAEDAVRHMLTHARISG